MCVTADYEDSYGEEGRRKIRGGEVCVRLSPMQNMCAITFLASFRRLRLSAFSLFVDPTHAITAHSRT